MLGLSLPCICGFILDTGQLCIKGPVRAMNLGICGCSVNVMCLHCRAGLGSELLEQERTISLSNSSIWRLLNIYRLCLPYYGLFGRLNHHQCHLMRPIQGSRTQVFEINQSAFIVISFILVGNTGGRSSEARQHQFNDNLCEMWIWSWVAEL